PTDNDVLTDHEVGGRFEFGKCADARLVRTNLAQHESSTQDSSLRRLVSPEGLLVLVDLGDRYETEGLKDVGVVIRPPEKNPTVAIPGALRDRPTWEETARDFLAEGIDQVG